jgi:hypothetical protein
VEAVSAEGFFADYRPASVEARVMRALVSPDIPDNPLAWIKLPGDQGFGSEHDWHAARVVRRLAQAAVLAKKRLPKRGKRRAPVPVADVGAAAA